MVKISRVFLESNLITSLVAKNMQLATRLWVRVQANSVLFERLIWQYLMVPRSA